MQSKRRKMTFLLAWVMANAIGGFLIGFLENNGAQFMATLFLSGAIIGSLQWGLLRWRGYRGRGWKFWPLVSSFGWIIGTLLSSVSISIDSTVDALTAQFGLWDVFWLNLILQPIWVFGMAIAQGLILSHYNRPKMRTLVIWVVASCLGAALHGAVGAWFCNAFCPILSSTTTGLVQAKGWAAYGIVTGLAIAWLVTDTPAEQPEPLRESLPLK